MRAIAVILAAGFSSRMGAFKPLLPLRADGGERCALELLCDLYAGLGVPVLAVSGFRGDEVDAAARARGARCVRNPHPENGMFSSVLTGLAALPDDTDAVFVHPADIPLTRPMTPRRLLDAAAGADDGAVLLPAFAGKEGHPPLLTRSAARHVREWRGQGGLRDALEELPRRLVPVADSLCLPDMDTPEDYAAMREAAARRSLLTPAEAETLLEIEGLPPRGRRHCRAVGTVAATLARALNAARAARGAPLIREEEALVGGLLHDICKGQPDHEAAAGRLLRRYGLERLAWLVESHRDLSLPDDAPLSARELVFLADKVVCGAWALPLERRFQQKLDQFREDPEACAAIRGRRDRAARLAARFAAEAHADPAALALSVVPSWDERERTDG